MKAAAFDLGASGVRVNAVAPLLVATEIMEGIVPDSRKPLARYGHVHALGRVGESAKSLR